MTATIELSGFDKAADDIMKLELEIRTKAVAAGLRAAGNVVKKEAKRRIPSGLQTGSSLKKSKDKQNEVRLRDWIKTKVKHYQDATVAVVGADYTKAPHGHLFEEGHEMVLWGRPTGARVPGKEQFAPAADSTKDKQEKAIVDAIVKTGKKYGAT